MSRLENGVYLAWVLCHGRRGDLGVEAQKLHIENGTVVGGMPRIYGDPIPLSEEEAALPLASLAALHPPPGA